MRLLYLALYLALFLTPTLATWRSSDKASRPPLTVHLMRWFLGFLFAFSGLAKLVPGFPNSMGPAHLESQLAPYGLALFARFVAVSELAVGLLLLTRRFATLGALLLLPMLASILMVTISLEWRGTPYVNTFFILLNLALLAYDYPKLLPLLADRPRNWPPPAASLLAASSTQASSHPWRADGAASSVRAALAAQRSHFLWLLALGALLLALGLFHAPASAVLIVLVTLACVALLAADWRNSS